MLAQGSLQLAGRGPDPREAVVAARSQQVAVTIPIQRCDVLVGGHLLPLHLDAVLQHLHMRITLETRKV